MPLGGGAYTPSEVALLGRVFDRTAVPKETETEREARARRIISRYQAGATDELELEEAARMAEAGQRQ